MLPGSIVLMGDYKGQQMIKCCVIGCELLGIHRVRMLPGRLYCDEHRKTTVAKIAKILRAEYAIRQRNEAADNQPARQPADLW